MFNNQKAKTEGVSLHSIYSEILQIFNKNNLEELTDHLSMINTEDKQVCSKILQGGKTTLIIGDGAWICKDCEKDSTCIICDECYQKAQDKHIGHRVSFKNSVHGCCDCGDVNA
jgi:hypothetical protein